MSEERIPLYYTFGNHMHWVDMEWLWGYHVMPGSVRDMLRFCNETGAKGNVNFDGIGYEKLAVEAPDALAELRQAVQRGQIEVVGASYGQPYGLFHGGESNVRQCTYGVRAVMRLLGVRPKTFWEEEFDFFPQLPQLLRGVGFEYASLFFQWTWHTPHVPKESLPAIWWEGLDGSRLLAAPRNDLNVHQWPEDFDGLLDSALIREMPVPGLVQWLELMPSPDWMCRSELLLPRLQALKDDPRFELRFATLSEYLEAAREHAQPRRYTLDDVFHGMSLGKNGDNMRHRSREAEGRILAAESLSAMMGLFGRPYPHWDVYPTWELEEAWRELLSAQHHDNDECEGLCGHVGIYSYDRSGSITDGIIQRAGKTLAHRVNVPKESHVVYNPLGWERDAFLYSITPTTLVKSLPPFGYRVAGNDEISIEAPPVEVVETEHEVMLRRGQFSITVNKAQGAITQLTSAEFPNGVLHAGQPLASLIVTQNGREDRLSDLWDFQIINHLNVYPRVVLCRFSAVDEYANRCVSISIAPDLDALDIAISAPEDDTLRPDPGMNTALHTTIAPNIPGFRLIHDHPYGLSEITAQGTTYLRKYPSGDWMTSPQWFEEVHNPFTALSLLDFDDGERGLLYLHNGNQQFFREGDAVRHVLTMYDPWDEDYFDSRLNVRVRLIPHGKITHAERWKLAQEFTNPPIVLYGSGQTNGDMPPSFGSVWCDAPGVAVTAFFRETEESGQNLESYAGRGMGFPYVLRLVEFNGEPAAATVRVPGPVAAAFKTNLLGEIIEPLDLSDADAPIDGPAQWQAFTLKMRPHEVATVYLDLVPGRKIPRNLDEHRHIWATVHRVDAP